MNVETASVEKPITSKKILTNLILSFLGGVILAIAGIILVKTGLFQPWEVVATVPENTVEILDGSPWGAQVRTADNKVWSCGFLDNDCWKRGVNQTPFRSSTCDPNQIAFFFLLNPPKPIKTCTQISDNLGGEMDYDALFVIDDENQLWRWDQATGMEVLLFPFIAIFGGLIGMSVRSLTIFYKRFRYSRSTNKPLPRLKFRHSIPLALPFIIIACLILSWLGLQIEGNSNVNSRSTKVAAAVSVQATEEMKPWQTVAVPDPGPTRYKFADFGCDIQITAGWGPLTCGEGNSDPTKAVRITQVSLPGSPGQTGDALVIFPVSTSNIHIQFPAITLEDGDHFKTFIDCVEKEDTCNMIFEIYFDTQTKNRISLGQWNPANDQYMENLDIDLSSYSGEKARFSFEIYPVDRNSSIFNESIWINPRIEKD